jgi:curli biogenesis system outer membrane secretion channel CsgG
MSLSSQISVASVSLATDTVAPLVIRSFARNCSDMLIALDVKLVDANTGDVMETASPSRNSPNECITHVEVLGIENVC